MTQVNELLKDKEKDKKKSEHKKHKKDHHKDKDEKPTTSKVKTIEQLRAERWFEIDFNRKSRTIFIFYSILGSNEKARNG